MKMPFWFDSGKNEYRAKLEHKMCMAKEAPETSFDLADCNLYEVPSGVFSMCRVFLKESLYLQNNNLTSLQNGGSLMDLRCLLVLSLENNRFSSLPNNIDCLTSLKELNLENNRLKKLPDNFSKLLNLRMLNLKGNRLVTFPLSICSLIKLERLNICDNSKIKKLPTSLSNLMLLKCFKFDAGCFTYPSADICESGLESIMKFLCSESGKEYVAVDYTDLVNKSDVDSSGPSDDSPDASASYQLYQRAKEQKQKDLMMMEEALKLNYETQLQSTNVINLRRQKLLKDISEDQERMENEILLLQNRKDKEKYTLLEILAKVENHSASLIKHLMSLNNRREDLEKMLATLEKDRLDNEEIFAVKQEELEQLRKKEILESMTETLQSEEKHRNNEIGRDALKAKLQNEENESNLKLFNIFQGREIDQQILLNKLIEEEQYQKQAFEALQLRKDQQHQEIAQQIMLIEKELSSLTAAELKKKDLKVSSDVNTLAEHRTALAYLLTDLLSAREKREADLKERLDNMEKQRIDEMEDFWLIQYQKLLDRKPKTIIEAESEMDSDVRQILEDSDALDFLPMFATKHIILSDLISFTIKDLRKIGILDEDICQRIIDKTLEYYENNAGYLPELLDHDEAVPVPPPSAPPLEEEPHSPPEILNPSAPPLSPDGEVRLWCQTECVICLDKRSTSVFLPCGHVCCCQNCSISVDFCPMCRTTIISKCILTTT